LQELTNELNFTCSFSPLAKRAVIRTTPTKMKQTVADATVACLLDDGSKSKTSGLTNSQRKYKKLFKGLMAPSGAALNHPVAPLLLELATIGCTADVGDTWSIKLIETAINKGAHPSAMEPVAAAQL
jgi:hypothetical protein